MCCVTISSLQAAHGTSRELPRALLNHVLFSLILLPSQPSIAIIYTEAVYKCGMAAAMGYHLADLFHGMMESFKLLFAPQSFGSEYELLCTDLSVYLLRIQLWANSVSRHGSLLGSALMLPRLDCPPKIGAPEAC